MYIPLFSNENQWRFNHRLTVNQIMSKIPKIFSFAESHFTPSLSQLVSYG